MELLDSGCNTTTSRRQNTNYESDNHRLSGMLSDSQSEKEAPTGQQQFIALMNPLYLKDSKGTLTWTPAHPEKRNSMSVNWSRDDCLNHIADIVAGGLTDFDINCQFNFIQLQAEDIMGSLILPNNWTLNMKVGSTPILAELQQQIDNWSLMRYLQRRDEYRAELIIARPPVAAQIYDVPKEPNQ